MLKHLHSAELLRRHRIFSFKKLTNLVNVTRTINIGWRWVVGRLLCQMDPNAGLAERR
jgi:hypothetical protein